MEPFVGQLLLASFGYPTGPFVFCNGQTLPINSNQALFSLLGTAFGGDGRTTFGLPNLQGRTPIGFGNGTNMGDTGGEEGHTLTAQEVPIHGHGLNASASSSQISPTANLLGTAGVIAYAAPTNQAPMNPASLSMAGGSQPHENRQPFLVMNWMIALTGIFPSRG
jgi:microcystin-dependent protein